MMKNEGLAAAARRALFLAIAGGLATGADPATAEGGTASPPTLLRLQHDQFDPLHRQARLPDDLARLAVAAEDAARVVQFRSAIGAEAHRVLAESGVEVLGYVPDFAFLVRASVTQLQLLAAHPEVRWTGPWLPAYRLDPALLARAATADATKRQLLDVQLMPGAQAATLRAVLAARFPSVRELGTDASTADRLLRIEASDAELGPLAQRPEILWIEPYRPVRRANALARQIVGQDHIESVLGLYGDGQMIGVGDDGLSTGNLATLHPDFAGRVAGATATNGGAWGFDAGSDHGTHVAGTVLGSGLLDGADPAERLYAGSAAGLAPEALLYVWALCPCDSFLTLPGNLYSGYLQPQYDFDTRLRISNNSWGSSFNGYTGGAQQMDRFVRDHPDMVVLVAAGNEGDGANTVGAPATAKNAIAVGSIANSTAGEPAYAISSFSSRGPVADGRLKPDLVAPGEFLLSTRTQGGVHGYMFMAGTSMATPAASGAAAIVRQFYQQVEGIPEPSAALIKASLINGAKDIDGGPIRLPAMDQGWGRIDLRQALVHENGRSLWYYEHPGLATGETFSATLNLQDTGFPIHATLVWSDAAALSAAAPNLVNDLDLVLTGPPGATPDTYTGNDRLGDGLLDLDVDRQNNVEGVDVESPIRGEWTLSVTGHNVPDASQPFALVASGGFAPWSALSLEVTPESASVCAGSSAADLFALRVRRNRSDLTAPVSLAVAGLPGMIAADFAANGLPADFDSALSLDVGATAPGANYAMTLQAEANGVGTLVAATLTVLPLPSATTLLEPAADASDVSPRPSLSWQPALDADAGYRVEVAADADFAVPVFVATVSESSLILPIDLELLATYHWRVTALNACGETAGQVRSFTVLGPAIFTDDFE